MPRIVIGMFLRDRTDFDIADYRHKLFDVAICAVLGLVTFPRKTLDVLRPKLEINIAASIFGITGLVRKACRGSGDAMS